MCAAKTEFGLAAHRRLDGARVLVVEDEFIIALELKEILEDAGASVIGPASTVAEALKLGREVPSCAILDLRLGHESVAPVARMLTELRIPFIFYSGQQRHELTEWPDSELLAKPATPAAIVSALRAMLGA